MDGQIIPLPEPAAAGTPAAGDLSIAALLALAAEANAALLSGDSHRYDALVRHTDDFTLMSPFGGPPTHGFDRSSERLAALGRFFVNGITSQQDVVQTYACADMAVLVLIERQRVEVGGLPAQDWPLRVTLVFRREGAAWCLAHRHADPLVNGISLEHAAMLARGDGG